MPCLLSNLMFRIPGNWQADCDGIRRRDFLRFGTLAGLGLSASASLGATAGLDRSFGRAKRCVLLFLTGGPPQLDTFDMKPLAPLEIRGELKPVATRVPGMSVSELWPRVAKVTDKLCILRSVTHGDRVHTSAGYTMLTGVPHPLANTATAANVRATPHDHPHLGALVARFRPNRAHVPTFASLPEYIKDDGVNEYPGQGGGLMGKGLDPLRIETDSSKLAFQPPAVLLPADISVERLSIRRKLRETLTGLEPSPNADLESSYRRAFDVIGSTGVQQAFDLHRETQVCRESYGQHLFGQGCLLARRLLEAGVSLVTVYWHHEGPADSPVWDTHGKNFSHLRERLCPPTDQAVAALVGDLDQRGMLADTLFMCFGEFGRTPKINARGGRDHWPGAQSILLAGAGVPAGQVRGATDRHAAFPTDLPVGPADLTATFLHLLGIPPDLTVTDRTGRPLPVCSGRPVPALLA